MTTQTAKLSTTKTGHLGAIVLALSLGMGIVFVSGLAQATTLHDAAHDVRHAIGFPCH